MDYPILLTKEPETDYGVIVPDLPGCFSGGHTVDEAMVMAREAIELHLEGMLEDGETIPDPGDIETHRVNPEFNGGIWGIVSVNPGHLRVKAEANA